MNIHNRNIIAIACLFFIFIFYLRNQKIHYRYIQNLNQRPKHLFASRLERMRSMKRLEGIYAYERTTTYCCYVVR